MEAIFFCISFLSSIIGCVSGIGGGVIMKPILDVIDFISISSISFLSACTVLSMSMVSVLKELTNRTTELNLEISTPLAIGASIGGILGKSIFEFLKVIISNESGVGLIQSSIMVIIIIGSILFTLMKYKIKTFHVKNTFICMIIGLILGVMSSFLGIGGGPINIIILTLFFSMLSNEAAINSIYIIMFSQVSSIIYVIYRNKVPEIGISFLITMIIGGILGGILGTRFKKYISNKNLDKVFLMMMMFILFINMTNIYKFYRFTH